MRIISGELKGRTLATPKTHAVIRPTADRVRQTIFDVLGQWCEGWAVVDLYAGTGALAFEALSRGAASAVLVDSGREALSLSRENAAALGVSARTRVLAMPVARAVPWLGRQGQRFELVFVDPPYADRAGLEVLTALDEHQVVAPGGRVVLEHDKREVLPGEVGGLTRIDERAFGDTRASFYVDRKGPLT